MKFWLALAIFIASINVFAVNMQCKNLFHIDDSVTKAVKTFQDVNANDTTALRREVKYVIKTAQLNEYLKLFEAYFGERWKNRDKAADGQVNITSTHYMTVAKFIQNGKRLSAKVRFRKYFTSKEGDTYGADMRPADGFKDRSWLELKIQHPEFSNVVIKPRLMIWDTDVKKLTNEEFFDYRTGIIRRLKELNPNKDKDIAKFIGFFDALYTTPAMRVQNLFAKTSYARTSYSVKLLAPSGQKIDVQLTLDSDIRLLRLKDHEYFNAYAKDETVIEVKIPLAFSELTPDDIAEIPELQKIKNLIDWLDANHVPKYPKNKGKMSKIDKDIPEDALIEDANDYD